MHRLYHTDFCLSSPYCNFFGISTVFQPLSCNFSFLTCKNPPDDVHFPAAHRYIRDEKNSVTAKKRARTKPVRPARSRKPHAADTCVAHLYIIIGRQYEPRRYKAGTKRHDPVRNISVQENRNARLPAAKPHATAVASDSLFRALLQSAIPFCALT